jgi:hypothetical protein
MTDATPDGKATKLATRRLTARQLEVWCDSIAQGESAFPGDVTPDDFKRIVVGVGRRRRQWLLNFIAEAIANDIVHANPQLKGNTKC